MVRRIVSVVVAVAAAACGLATEGLPGASTSATSSSATAAAGSSGSATGGGDAATAATATGTATGGGGSETCLNGVDDDGDGAADCEDEEDCAAFTCVPAHPGEHLAPPVGRSCAAGQSPAVLTSCGACACDTAPGTCTLEVTTNAESDCASVVRLTGEGAGCHQLPSSDGIGVGVIATPIANGDATCAPSAASAKTEEAACVLAETGACPGGQACVPAAGPGTHCVLSDVACRSPYAFAEIVYVDSPGACGCECGDGTQVCPADQTVGVYPPGAPCMGTPKSVAGDGACHNSMLPQVQSVLIPRDFPASAVACSPTPSNGGAVPKYLCCAPRG